MPGWSWGEDDADELTIREGENAVRQTRRLVALISEAVESGVCFELRSETIR